MLIQVLLAVAVLAGLGLIFGVLIAVLSKVLYVKVDTKIEDIHKMLPGYNCGGCGKSGCSAMATAIVEEGFSPDYCKPIKPEQAQAIKEYLKKALEEEKNESNSK